MLFLVAIGTLSFNYGKTYSLILGLVIIIALILFLNEKICLWIIYKMKNIPKIGRYVKQLETIYRSAYSLLVPTPLTIGVTFSFIAWGIECFCLFLVIRAIGIDIGLLDSIFIFSFSSIIGVLTMLPGGIGSSEISMSELMILKGAVIANATAATLIIRASTLWFAVILGLIFLQKVFIIKDSSDIGVVRNKTKRS